MKKKFLFALVLPLMLGSCAPAGQSSSTNDIHGGTGPESSVSIDLATRTLITEAKSILEDLIRDVIENSHSVLLVDSVREFSVEETAYLESITTLEEAEKAERTLYDHENVYTHTVMIPLFHKALNDEIVPMINKIKDEERRGSCFDEYNVFLSQNEIGGAFDIASVGGVYEGFYDMVKSYMGIEEEDDPDHPGEDPEPTSREELNKYIEAARNTITWYTEAIINRLSYPDLFNVIWSFFDEQMRKFEEAETIDDIYDLTDEIKAAINEFAHEASRGAAIEDLSNTFEELESYFTKKEVLDLVAKIKERLMNSLLYFLDRGMELEDYKPVVENYQAEAVDFLWFSDIHEYYIADLDQVRQSYLEMETNEEFVRRINDLYSICADRIKYCSDLDDYEADIASIIENFEEEATKILADYQH